MARQTNNILSGHGIVITDPETVAMKHLNEQEQRYKEVVHFMENAEKPLTLYEVIKALMPQINQPEQVFLTLSEVMGYLDWAAERGKIKTDETDKPITFYKL